VLKITAEKRTKCVSLIGLRRNRCVYSALAEEEEEEEGNVSTVNCNIQ
jgi:hypothetical protein